MATMRLSDEAHDGSVQMYDQSSWTMIVPSQPIEPDDPPMPAA